MAWSGSPRPWRPNGRRAACGSTPLRPASSSPPSTATRWIRSARPTPSGARRSATSARERPGLGTDEPLLAGAPLLSATPAGGIVVCHPTPRAFALMGELSARALAIKGVSGYVVDGACRDVDLVEESGLAVFCSHVTPADIAGRWLPDPVGGPITIGRCAIATGDYLIADRDGVVILPEALAARAVAE